MKSDKRSRVWYPHGMRNTLRNTKQKRHEERDTMTTRNTWVLSVFAPKGPDSTYGHGLNIGLSVVNHLRQPGRIQSFGH
jgi:hypothetical protein